MNDDSVPFTVTGLRAEHRTDALGIGHRTPRLSWRTVTEQPSWAQTAYEIEIDGEAQGRVEHDDSVLVPWPARPLESRQQIRVRVRVWGNGDEIEASLWSEPLHIEAGLFSSDDWVASWITPVHRDPLDKASPAPLLRREFELASDPASDIVSARLYVTSAGVHRLELNGQPIGDRVLAPGWSSYPHQLRYDTHDVTGLLSPGSNVLGACLGDGWWRGHLTWAMQRNTYGDRLGLLGQLEVTYSDGTTVVITTDQEWQTATGAILASDLYGGESYDARLAIAAWSTSGLDTSSWGPVEVFEPRVGDLVCSAGPPVRRIEELAVAEVLTTPSGRTVLDFGQNLVGRVRFTVDGPTGTTVTLRHAEVLEGGEPAYEPLRNAEATDRYTLRGGGPETWEPDFTFHGFRYVEIEGWPGTIDAGAFAAVVLHTDLDRTGTFTCSDELVNKLHANVVWGMRGNFIDVPTDCPQRDERMGWTGDIQVFAPSAAYLYDVVGTLQNWLADLRADQAPDGRVPVVVPELNGDGIFLPEFAAGWSDAATTVPWALYDASGDRALLDQQFESMRGWVDWVTARTRGRRIWFGDFQFGDWLDPTAPADNPTLARTDTSVVATAYWARSAQLVADAAELLGHEADAATYGHLAEEIRSAFRAEFLTPRARLMSDTSTAYALAIVFDLVDDPKTRDRLGAHLARLSRSSFFTISTGFLGTPVVLQALSLTGHSDIAYKLLLQTAPPSWLYSVTMGATTIWERWDSVLPDGRVNGAGMTSFNHYALGSVAAWLHEVVGGLAPGEPGYRTIHMAPVPGAGISSASAQLETPYGTTACAWSVLGTTVTLRAVVPPNSTALITLPGRPEHAEVGSGTHTWNYEVESEIAAAWSDQAKESLS